MEIDTVTQENAGELVQVLEGRTVVDTRDVAKRFGKRHDKLAAEIRRMYGDFVVSGDGLHQNGDTPGPLFIRYVYVHPQNRQEYMAYIMNRDAFSLLVMGFTGKEALRWKLNYIRAFNFMERKLRRGIMPDETDSRIMGAAESFIRELDGIMFPEEEEGKGEATLSARSETWRKDITAAIARIVSKEYEKSVRKDIGINIDVNIDRNELFSATYRRLYGILSRSQGISLWGTVQKWNRKSRGKKYRPIDVIESSMPLRERLTEIVLGECRRLGVSLG